MAAPHSSQPLHTASQPPKPQKSILRKPGGGRNGEQPSTISPPHSQLQPSLITASPALPSFTAKYLQSSQNALDSSKILGSGRDVGMGLPAPSKG